MSKNTPSQPTNGRLTDKAVSLPGNGPSETPPSKAIDSSLASGIFGSGRSTPSGTPPASNDSEGQEDLPTTTGRDEEIIAMVRAMTRESRQAAPPLPLVRDEIDKRVSDLAAEKTRELNRVANSVAMHTHRLLANDEENTNAWNY